MFPVYCKIEEKPIQVLPNMPNALGAEHSISSYHSASGGHEQ